MLFPAFGAPRMAIFRDFWFKGTDAKLLSDCGISSWESFAKVPTFFEKHRRKYRELARIINLSIVNNISQLFYEPFQILCIYKIISAHEYESKHNLTSSSVHSSVIRRRKRGTTRDICINCPAFYCNFSKKFRRNGMDNLYIRALEARSGETAKDTRDMNGRIEKGRLSLAAPCCCCH